MNRCFTSFFAVAASLLLLTGCSVFADPGPDSTGTPAISKPDFPNGFKDREDGVATRFVDEEHCGQGRCSQIEIYAYGSCPSGVYVRADTMDESGAVVGFSNGFTGSLAEGDKAIATLPIHEDAATDVKITEVTCH